MEENLDELHQQLKDMKVAKEFKDTIKDTLQTHPTPVSYTHLTLPTIYSV